jgi:hypothetical protein
MLVFVDDSGDAGFKIDKGSTHFFVIALVIFSDELEAEKVAVAIKTLRRSLGFSDESEFKFAKSRNEIRKKFLETIAPFSFTVRALVVDKQNIYSPKLRHDKNSFYSYSIKSVLKFSGGTITNAKIRIDGSGDRIFRKTFAAYLRKELNGHERKIMRDCKLIDSHSSVLIQMADMVAGAIRRSYEVADTASLALKNIIAVHIEDEWQFK